MKHGFLVVSLLSVSAFLDAKKINFIEQDLFSAVRADDYKRVTKILSQGIPVNSINADKNTVLDIAVDHQNLKMARLLMKKGGKVTSVDNADQLRNMLKTRGFKFSIGGIFFWPFWLGTFFAISDAFDVKVMVL